jgi:CMP-N,N'-diacetyllegionaminic acid synthase
MRYRSVAFIPARSGSKRVPDKNIKLLGDHPLIAYSIVSALESSVFDSVICATDSAQYAEIAKYYGAEVPFLRPDGVSGDKSPDCDWVAWMLNELKKIGLEFKIFSILRPTSPFRLPCTISRAWDQFIEEKDIDSLRAVQKCKQHPGKMWIVDGKRMVPILPYKNGSVPWHSSQYTALPEIFIQDASLEISWVRNILDGNSIAGRVITPFLTKDYEGFDINNEEDFLLAQTYLSKGKSVLPKINLPPFPIK